MHKPKLKLTKEAFAVRWSMLSKQDQHQFIASAFGKTGANDKRGAECAK